jgi:beta-galactosidase
MHDLSADNPSLRLEYERFASEEQVGYCRLQLEAMRPFTAKPITTNGTGTSTTTSTPSTCSATWMSLDWTITRAPRHRLHPVLVPLRTGQDDPDPKRPGGLLAARNALRRRTRQLGVPGNAARLPGTFRQNSLHAFCSGAGLITLFKLHAFPFGFEQLGSSLIDLDRIPRRRFAEICDASRDLARIGPLLERTGSRPGPRCCSTSKTCGRSR